MWTGILLSIRQFGMQRKLLESLSRPLAFLFSHAQTVLQAVQIPKESAARALGVAQLVM